MLKKLIAAVLLTVAGMAGFAGQAYAGPRNQVFIDVDEPVLNDFQVTVGQKVYFTSQKQMKTVAITGKTVNELRKKSWPLLIRGSVLNGFEATNAGTAEVEITTGSVQPNGQPQALKLTVTVQPASVQFSTIEKGHASGYTAQLNKTITSDAEWARLWTAHTSSVLPAPALPQIDFQKEMVLAIYLGSRSSSGYKVEILTVEDDGTNLIVSYRETKPRPGSVGLTVITQPHHLVKVPLTSKPVQFKSVP